MSAAVRTGRAGWRGEAQSLFLMTAGVVCMILALTIFLAPSGIAPGGVSGTAVILNTVFGWPIGWVMLILNLPLLALGFRYLGRFPFLLRTAYVAGLYSVGTQLMTSWVHVAPITENALLNALYGGVLGGVGSGLIYRGRASVAGTGILARIVQLRTGMPVSQVFLLTDGGVVAAAALVLGWENGLYSLLALFIWGLATDYVLEGPSVVRTAFIVTDHPGRVADSIIGALGIGVTTWAAQGQFTGETHTVLFCTVSRPDVDALREAVTGADAQAFVVIGHGHQSTGGVLRAPVPRSSADEPPERETGAASSAAPGRGGRRRSPTKDPPTPTKVTRRTPKPGKSAG
jgi:uncharacterized membrane-anchored protein YitT (DUF2179 family)